MIKKSSMTKAPMFPEIQSEGKSSPLPEHVRCAKQLNELLGRKRSGAYSSKSWSNVIRLMVKMDNVQVDEISSALEWYAENFDNQYTPKAFNAEMFRKKFQAIRAAQLRDRPKEIELDEAGKKTLRSISLMGWRQIDPTDLKHAVSLSLSNYGTMSKRILDTKRKFRQEGKSRLNFSRKEQVLRQAIQEIANRYAAAPNEATYQYFQELRKMIQSFDGKWNGDIRKFAFSPTNTREKKKIFAMSYSVSGNEGIQKYVWREVQAIIYHKGGYL